MFCTDSITAQRSAPRVRRRSLLHRNGIPESNDILAKRVRWAKVRFYFLDRRKHVRLAASICAALNALEDYSRTLPLATNASGKGTMTDMNVDLLYVGSQFA